jgi:hypothetical protein
MNPCYPDTSCIGEKTMLNRITDSTLIELLDAYEQTCGRIAGTGHEQVQRMLDAQSVPRISQQVTLGAPLFAGSTQIGQPNCDQMAEEITRLDTLFRAEAVLASLMASKRPASNMQSVLSGALNDWLVESGGRDAKTEETLTYGRARAMIDRFCQDVQTAARQQARKTSAAVV